MAPSVLDKSSFRNVDLDISSRFDLQPLVTAMGSKVSPSFVGRVKRTYFAHMDLAIGNPSDPDSAILQYCKLIQRLPPDARALWDTAKTRTFDIGVDAPERNTYYWSAVGAAAIQAASQVGAQIAITLYGPMKIAKAQSRSRGTVSPK